jgi:transcriptional regulator with XRE-family HTH domain
MLARKIGGPIHRARLAAGLTQQQLASNARVSRSVLSRLEQGTADVVQSDVLDRLFQALGTELPVGESGQDARRRARAEQLHRLEANRSRHLRLAVALASDAPAAEPLIARARERVEVWRTRRSCSPRYIEAWAQALNHPPAGVAQAMTRFGEWEDAMFQNSPWSWAWS